MKRDEIDKLNEAFLEWLRGSGYSDKTVNEYGKTWFRKFPHSLFNEATEEEAQEIINDFFRVKKNNNSVARGFLKSYLEWTGLNKTYDIPRNKVREKKRIPKYLSVEEIKQLQDAMEKKGYLHWLAFQLIYEGGLRRSELNTIKYNSFEWDIWLSDPDRSIILRVIGKGDKERLVTISSNTIIKHLQKVKEHFRMSDVMVEEWLSDVKKKDLKVCKFKANWFYKWLRIASQEVLGKPVNPHLLRHSRATHLLDKGNEIKDIQNYLGHANISTTEVYLHRDKKQSLLNIMRKENI